MLLLLTGALSFLPEHMFDPDADAEFDPTRAQFVGCPLCGFDTSDTPGPDLPSAISDAARRWSDWLLTVLDHPGGLAELLEPPEPDEWCALEYACHVRDGLAVYSQYLMRTVLEEIPELVTWDHAAAAMADNYVEQDPKFVAQDLLANAAEMVEILQVMSGDAWLRRATRDGTPFTMLGIGRYALHELRHHLLDAQDGVAPELP